MVWGRTHGISAEHDIEYNPEEVDGHWDEYKLHHSKSSLWYLSSLGADVRHSDFFYV